LPASLSAFGTGTASSDFLTRVAINYYVKVWRIHQRSHGAILLGRFLTLAH
jgi:hypothetical protein